MNLSIAMTHAKETKGTQVYDAVDDDAPIRTLYVKKAAFVGGDVPTTITVTVT